MPDRMDMKRGETIGQHTLRKAWEAIWTAINHEDGLDGAEGEHVLQLIEDSLGYNPATKMRCPLCKTTLAKCKGH